MKNLLLVLALFVAAACSASDAQRNGNTVSNASSAAANAKAQATPSNKFTAADIAKLKWLEGAWRGMDGDKPFFERYKFEENAMIVESLKEDGSADGDPGRFELKNGEFGQGEAEKRSAASEIGNEFVQFVPAVAGKGNNYRFEKRPYGWDAILDWPAAADKPARSKTYKMEPWQPKK